MQRIECLQIDSRFLIIEKTQQGTVERVGLARTMYQRASPRKVNLEVRHYSVYV